MYTRVKCEKITYITDYIVKPNDGDVTMHETHLQ